MTPSARPFLTAQWRDLIIVSYVVTPTLLTEHLPETLEPELVNGLARVSLVAFRFVDTRVFGIRWPGMTHFPEINLRCYAQEKQGQRRRGVLFIKELVASPIVAGVAKCFYNEPYEVADMSCSIQPAQEHYRTRYDFRIRGTHSIRVEASPETFTAPPESPEHWYKEHEWGFGIDRKGREVVYRVQHPVWKTHRDVRGELHVNFAAIYGEKWGVLDGATPESQILAVGSEVAVYPASNM